MTITFTAHTEIRFVYLLCCIYYKVMGLLRIMETKIIMMLKEKLYIILAIIKRWITGKQIMFTKLNDKDSSLSYIGKTKFALARQEHC